MRYQILGIGLFAFATGVAAQSTCSSGLVYSYIKEGLSHSDIELICNRADPNTNKCCCTTVEERLSKTRIYSTKPNVNSSTWVIVRDSPQYISQILPRTFCEGVRYDNEFFRTRSYCNPLSYCER